MSDLTHVDESGAARMVDVTGKAVTSRVAVATGLVHTTAEVVDLLASNGLKKGDALAVARIAGIMGAKKTPDLVPLCHPLAITGVAVDFSLDDTSVGITDTMLLAAADAIADVVDGDRLNASFIVPSVFDSAVAPAVAEAVARAAAP